MIIAKEIVHRVLLDQDAGQFLRAGVSEAWAVDPQMAGLFGSEPAHANAFRYVFRHVRQHGRPPSMELFRRNFPESGYKLQSEPPLPSELIEEAEYTRKMGLSVWAMQAIQDLYLTPGFVQGDREHIDQMVQRIAQAHENLQAASSSKQKYRTATLDDLLSLPDPEALIDGALDAGTVCMLSGPSGKGKSFIAVDWSLCVASGNDWLGRATRQGSVCYVAAEGFRSLGHRGKAWQHEFGKVQPETVTFVTEPVQLDDPGTAYLTGLIRETGADLLVIDTLARCTVGMEENSARDMGLVVDRLYKLRDSIEECGTTILTVHHSGYNDKRARGSSALAAGMDCVTDIQGNDPHEAVILSSSKRKDGEPFRDITVKLRETYGSCVLEEHGLPAGEPNLRDLLDGPGVTVAELAKVLRKERSTITKQLGKMEKAGTAVREQQQGAGDLWQKNKE